MCRRRLHGRRGLKSQLGIDADFCIRRRLHGRRGLKFRRCASNKDFLRRRLHGRRGLKSCQRVIIHRGQMSPPSRAAWIEIAIIARKDFSAAVAAFTGGVD